VITALVKRLGGIRLHNRDSATCRINDNDESGEAFSGLRSTIIRPRVTSDGDNIGVRPPGPPSAVETLSPTKSLTASVPYVITLHYKFFNVA